MTQLANLPYVPVKGPKDPVAVSAELDALRDRHWLVRSDRGLEILTYEKCDQLLRDPAWIQGVATLMKRDGIEVRRDGAGRTLSFTEGDEHAALRKFVQPWFSGHRVELLRAKVEALAGSLLASVAAQGRCDFHRDIAFKIPPRVFCWMVGADEAVADDLAAWGEAAIKAFNHLPEEREEVQAGLRNVFAFAAKLVADKKRQPGDDLISYLLAGTRDGILTEADVIALANETLAASSDNTAHTMTSVLYMLCRHPEQWDLLARDPALVPAAIEETMRIFPRVRTLLHINPKDTDFGGLHFPAGAHVYARFESANRDPAIYPDPDRFDVTRRPARPHLNFGIGRHMCLGAALARMEVQTVLRTLLARWQRPEPIEEPPIKLLDDMAIGSLKIAFRPR